MDNDLKQTLANNLLFYRQKSNLSQEALAEMVGISQSFYAKLESGKRLMGIDVLCRLADCLNVSVDSLLFKRTDTTKINNIIHILHDKSDPDIDAAEKVLTILLKELENARNRDRINE